MIDEGYLINLYCDYPGHDFNVTFKMDWQDQFSGRNKGECIKEIKKIGWKLKKDGTVICPYCAKLKKDKVAEYVKEWSKV